MTLESPAADQRQAQLRQFIVLDLMAVGVAAVVTTVLNVVTVRNGWLWLVTFLVAAVGVALVAALRSLRNGQIVRAVSWVAGANWGIAVAASTIATFSWPLMQLAALLPAIVAVPYVPRSVFRVFVVTSVGVSILAGLAGLLQDVTGLTDAVPDWVRPTVLVIFVPAMSILLAQAGAGAAAHLTRLLEESLAVNERLTESEAALEEQAELLRQSRARIVAAADRERQRIERDLHDGAQQRIVGLGLQVAWVNQHLESDPEGARTALDEIRAELRRAQHDMRSLVRGIYPPLLSQQGLAPAIRAVVVAMDKPFRDGIQDVGRHPPDVEAAFYFTCLEAVQNALKHTPAESIVSIQLRCDRRELLLRVRDDGPGFVSGTTEGSGLGNMTDRIRAAGGLLTIDSSLEQGTCVEARFPVSH